MPSSLPGGWTLGGEQAICCNGRLLYTRLSPTVEHHPEGLGSESPRLCPPPTSHLFPASSRFNFGSRHCLVRSLLHHLSPPWSLKKLSLCTLERAPECSRRCGSEWQSWRRKDVAVFGWHFCVMAPLPAGSALRLAARWEARPCRKGAQCPHVKGKSAPDSSAVKVIRCV